MRITKEERPVRCRDGLLICKNCGRGLCHIPTDITEFKFAVICGCGTLNSFDGRECDCADTGAALVCKNEHYKCPDCGRVVFSANPNTLTNIAFRIRCSCGRMYDKTVAYRKERRLGALPSTED